MATAVNGITGDLIKTKGSNDSYREGWDRIFGKSEEKEPQTIITEEIKIESQEQEDVKLAVNTEESSRMELTWEWWKWCERNKFAVENIPSFEQWKQNYRGRDLV